MIASVIFVVIQLISRVQLFATPWTAAHQASLSFTISQSLLKLMPIESVMPSHHLVLCHPLLLLPSIFPNFLNSFPMSWLFTSGGQGIEASASASVLPVNIQDWFPLGLTGLILQSTRLLWIFSNTTVQKHQFFGAQSFLWSNSLFYGPTVYTFSPSICHKVMEPDVMILVFWMLSFKPAFSLSYFIFIKRIFNSSSLSAIRVVSSVYPAILIPACGSFNWLFTWCSLHIS